MKMRRRDLAIFHDHDLLGVKLAFQHLPVLNITITNSEQEQTKGIKIAQPEVGNIPTEFVLDDLVYLRSFLLPGIGRPVSEGGRKSRGCE
jgi:hypothetical protein